MRQIHAKHDSVKKCHVGKSLEIREHTFIGINSVRKKKKITPLISQFPMGAFYGLDPWAVPAHQKETSLLVAI